MTIVLYMTALTWVTIIAASTIRSKGWTLQGLNYSLSNREEPLDTNALAHRADRTAANTLENFILFLGLASVAMASAAPSPLILQGAQLFLLARLVFVPVYYAGITYVRTLVWLAGIVGLIMMLMGLLA
jgi:uncharacterized MAPEG superfamily protein